VVKNKYAPNEGAIRPLLTPVISPPWSEIGFMFEKKYAPKGIFKFILSPPYGGDGAEHTGKRGAPLFRSDLNPSHSLSI